MWRAASAVLSGLGSAVALGIQSGDFSQQQLADLTWDPVSTLAFGPGFFCRVGRFAENWFSAVDPVSWVYGFLYRRRVLSFREYLFRLYSAGMCSFGRILSYLPLFLR